MKKMITVPIVVAIAAVSAGAYYYRSGQAGSQVSTAPITRGDVIKKVSASGTLEAVQTVLVGTQVSGTVTELHADFNSVVHKGQLVARLDPSILKAQTDQARANLERTRADVDRLEVSLEDARTKSSRAEALAAKHLIPQSELDSARIAVREAEVQLRSAHAQVRQVQATVNQNQVSLAHTDIYSPIDGIVIARNVDVGQTVAASLSAPTLFSIAADLADMQVKASVDESDVGMIRQGQTVQFKVDAYPADTFTGSVSQVRMQPVSSQNVVTYTTVIDVPNPDLKLLPGMTASVTIEVARRLDVVRIPNAALRYRPKAETFSALNQAPPDEWLRSKSGTTPAAAGRAVGTSGGVAIPAVATATSLQSGRPTTAVFGPLPSVESAGRVWLWVDGQLEPIAVRLGISDDIYTELIGDLPDGVAEVVTEVTAGQSTTTSTTRSPMMQGPPDMPPPPPPSASGGGGPR